MLLKAARMESGLTQRQLADKVGRQQPYLSTLENGHIFATPKDIQKIEKALDKKIDWVATRLQGMSLKDRNIEKQRLDTVLNHLWDFVSDAKGLRKKQNRIVFVQWLLKLLEVNPKEKVELL